LNYDEQNPVNRYGQVRVSALDQMARQSAIPQNQIATGDYWSTSFGSVVVPQQQATQVDAAIVNVTSLTKDSISQMYPGIVEITQDGTPAIVKDGVPPQKCWVITIGTGTLATGQQGAWFGTTHSDGLPIYIVQPPTGGGGSGAMSFLEVTGPIDGTSKMYPALLLVATDGEPVIFSISATQIWAWGPNINPVLSDVVGSNAYLGMFLFNHSPDGKPVYGVAGNVTTVFCNPTTNIVDFTTA
jgi:hypothetical protein